MSLIIKARNIRLDYAGRDVLDIDELEIHSYDRIGLVGDNGAGKSSLLKVLNGEIVLAEATLQRFGDFAHISQLGGIEIETVEDRAFISPWCFQCTKRHNEWRRGNSCKNCCRIFPTSTWHSSG
jgi:macrolide transport system ATP-binding/permease protein